MLLGALYTILKCPRDSLASTSHRALMERGRILFWKASRCPKESVKRCRPTGVRHVVGLKRRRQTRASSENLRGQQRGAERCPLFFGFICERFGVT